MDKHLLFAGINFAIYMGVLVMALRKPLKEFWGTRSEGLRLKIEQAHARRQKAESTYQEFSGRVRRITQEMEALRDKLRKDGELEKQELLEQAAAQAAQLERIAKQVADQETQKAQYSLRVTAARLTVDLAEQAVRRQLDDARQGQLVNDYLDRLESGEISLSEGGVVPC